MSESEQQDEQKRWLSPKDIVEERNIGYESVLQLIHTRQLKSVDVRSSSSKQGRPVYRVREDWLDEFFASRELQPVDLGPRRRRQRVKPGDVIEFFS